MAANQVIEDEIVSCRTPDLGDVLDMVVAPVSFLACFALGLEEQEEAAAPSIRTEFLSPQNY